MRLLIFGGRNFVERHRLWHEIHNTLDGRRMNEVTIIHGAARVDAKGENRTGADFFAHEFCETWKPWGLIEESYPAKWDDLTALGAVIRHRNGKPYNVMAGFTRNQEMIDVGKPTHALGTPGGNGTADMKKRLELAIKSGAQITLRMIETL